MKNIKGLAMILASTSLTGIALAHDRQFDPVDLEAAVPEAQQILDEMEDDEKTILTWGLAMFPNMNSLFDESGKIEEPPEGAQWGAGFIRGIDRFSVPPLAETDGPLGVAYVRGIRGDYATAFPASVLLGATFNPQLAYESGQAMGAETRALGFGVLLAGGANLTRDPRNGRTFEYIAEDPLLTGLMVGGQVAGIQSQNVISTVKHFALNGQETGRNFVDVIIDDASARESDLLAFQIALEEGQPGAVMCAYNLVNGAKACGNDYLLNQVLKQDWQYPGFVMSDWGAVNSVDFAWSGLDQQSGAQIDPDVFLDETLFEAAAGNEARLARIDDMNRRVLTSIIATGLMDNPVARTMEIDYEANGLLSLEQARQGIVLLKNTNGALPLSANAQHIAVIGGHADFGVLSGGGSSQVHGEGGPALVIRHDPTGFGEAVSEQYHRSSPLEAIRSRVPETFVNYRDGRFITDAVMQAEKADVAIVFATQWMSEGFDQPDLSLPSGQDALIAAVAAANPNTIVVLETGGPVDMPWLDDVAAVLQAWYPGDHGGKAIAEILFGDVNPSGHLPLTFPKTVEQLPRPHIPGSDFIEPGFLARYEGSLSIDYGIEGSDIGYRWFARNEEEALFPFGFGMSYTDFSMANFSVFETGEGHYGAEFDIANSGERAGADVAQVYLVSVNGETKRRLVGFDRAELEVGESKSVTINFDPRILAEWTGENWEIAAGIYTFALSTDAETDVETATVSLPAQILTQTGEPTN